MTASFAGVYAKLDRAEQLFRDLRGEAEELLTAYSSSVVKDRYESEVQVFVLRDAPAIPVSWGPLIGDIVHNLRSALDHTAWQLVIASGFVPRRPETSFPVRWVRPDPGKPEPTIRPRIQAQIQSLLLEEQPYERFAIEKGLHPRKSPLALVTELNNLDKHVDLIPVVSVAQYSSWSVPPDVSVQFEHRDGPLVSGEEVGRLRSDPPSNSDFGLEVKFSVRVRPEEGFPELAAGDLVGWLLGGSISYFRADVMRFEQAAADL